MNHLFRAAVLRSRSRSRLPGSWTRWYREVGIAEAVSRRLDICSGSFPSDGQLESMTDSGHGHASLSAVVDAAVVSSGPGHQTGDRNVENMPASAEGRSGKPIRVP